jgi:hypothetical protein
LFVIARQLEHMGLIPPGRLHGEGEARELHARKKGSFDRSQRSTDDTDARTGGSPENLRRMSRRRTSGTDLPLRRRSGDGQSPGYGAPVEV